MCVTKLYVSHSLKKKTRERQTGTEKESESKQGREKRRGKEKGRRGRERDKDGNTMMPGMLNALEDLRRRLVKYTEWKGKYAFFLD